MNPLLQHIAESCGGATRNSEGFVCRCPAHDDQTASLSVRQSVEGKLLVKCFAGCDQREVIDALKRLGLWPGTDRNGARKREAAMAAVARGNVKHSSAEWAAKIWNNSSAAKGTLVETYLRHRGITVPIPPAIRFHYGLRHPEGTRWPAMVALVTGAVSSAPTAIHRTFLAPDGTKAPVRLVKMMLGPCNGGVVRLGGQGSRLLIGEGIETCLSAMQATGDRTYAALSTSGMRKLELPGEEQDIVILADADEAGEAAAEKAARRWRREGRRVRIARPPSGLDINDLLNARARSLTESMP